jgi:hypothetical protein
MFDGCIQNSKIGRVSELGCDVRKRGGAHMLLIMRRVSMRGMVLMRLGSL